MFWNNFKKLCDLHGISPSALCAQLELGNSTSTAWKQGKMPGAEALLKIANAFNCSIDYLLGRTNHIEFREPTLSVDELELIQHFRGCSDRDQGRLLGEAKILAENFSKERA